MVFDLSVNISAFPKCKCGNDMALVKVVETETESFDKGAKVSLTRSAGNESDEKNALDIAVFIWKCGGCGNKITEKVDD